MHHDRHDLFQADRPGDATLTFASDPLPKLCDPGNRAALPSVIAAETVPR